MNDFSKKETQDSYPSREKLSEIAQMGGALGRRLEREIRRFERTEAISSWLTGETLKSEAAQNAAQQGAFRQQAINPILTVGQSIQLATASDPENFRRKLDVSDISTASAQLPPHPWKITIRTVPDTDPPEYEFKVEENSNLYSDLDSWSSINVDGLNEWQSASQGHVVLFGVVENGSCTEASIQGPQTATSNRIAFINDDQSSFAVRIGYIYDSGNNALKIRQNAFHNFTIMQSCIDGKAALYPFAT